MVTVTPPPIFELPWHRDAQDYRVIRSVDEIRRLWRRWEREQMPGKVDRESGRRIREARDPWPTHWPHPSFGSGWLERLAGLSEIPGGGLVWPGSDESEPCYPLRTEDKRGPAERLIATEGQKPEDCSDVLEFTGRYGLLWEDRPLTVEEFRAVRDNLAALAAANSEFRTTIDRHDRHKYEAAALIEAEEHARFAPRFTMELRAQPRHRRGLVPQIVPDNLYSLIALQVTEAVYSASVRWRRCDHCGGLFLAGTGTNRGGKAKFCTTSCKNKHADRKRERTPVAPRQDKEARHAGQDCPYCPESDRRAKRNPNHCGKDSCKMKHYRAKRKARIATA